MDGPGLWGHRGAMGTPAHCWWWKTGMTTLENHLKHLQKINMDRANDSADKGLTELIFDCCHDKVPQT